MNKNFLGVVIDPGHGGIDSGAVYNNLLEKDYNLLIMKDYLSNGERDPKRDAITREDWIVYGIIAPLAFIIILGVGEAIGRIFG